MADNYLERREEELRSGASSRRFSQRPSLDTLLKANRSTRSFDSSYPVHPLQIKSIISVNTKLASGMNRQTLRFRIVCEKQEVAALCALVKMGAALKDITLPPPGQEPTAFIVVCSTLPETPTIDIDLGISLQSMLLKAVEMGLRGLIIRNFKGSEVQSALGLSLSPLAVLALGKGAEKAELIPASPAGSLDYYRKEGVHFVPKLGLEDLLL